ncbi:MAG: PAS domain-containing sensor histidine kinase [Candidatus Riflebacteria bacterium]|nr:PAS domain-containing sensor histidine kinase [Candidatus Riflebacteria bacterium]
MSNQPLRPSEFAREVLTLLGSFMGAEVIEVLLFRGETLHHGVLSGNPAGFSYEVMAARLFNPDHQPAPSRDTLTIPLCAGRELLGHLLLGFPRPVAEVASRWGGLLEQIGERLGTVFTVHRLLTDLRERNKELTCLYGLVRVADDARQPIEETLQQIADLLPKAWQFPEITCARLVIDHRSFECRGFRTGPFRQEAEVVVGGKNRGRIEIFYTEERQDFGQHPFLAEEQALLNSIAREVALIVERRQTQEERVRLQGQLRHADRLATVGQLVAGVAHELNEPLTNILGYAQLIARTEGLPGQVPSDLDRIVRASLHAREIIKKLLYFSRQMPVHMAETDFNRIVEEGLYFLESRCAKEGIEIVRELGANLPPVFGDPSQLNQVLVNLIVNAIQAMPGGGRLTVRTDRRGGMVRLAIEDTGVGMDEEVRGMIFTPFFTTKEVGMGTGLGLSVVHGIVTSHGGAIQVESQPGKGARFEILLPALERPETKWRKA